MMQHITLRWETSELIRVHITNTGACPSSVVHIARIVIDMYITMVRTRYTCFEGDIMPHPNPIEFNRSYEYIYITF